MIVESLDEYFDILAGYIYDNDKLVTYKWLSKELEVHVNVAKQILWEFGQHRGEQNDLVRTFLLMGTLHDGGMRVEVVKEESLPSAKEKFSKIISEHIYSLQKALPDIELLAISGDGDIKYSAIECKESIKRTEEEMRKLRWGTALSNDIPVTKEKPKPVADPVKEKKEKSPEPKITGAKKSVQQKGFNNLFGKSGNKQKSPPSKSPNETKSKLESSHEKKKLSPNENASKSPKKKIQKGGLDGFFGPNRSTATVAQPTASEEKETPNPTASEKANSLVNNEASSSTNDKAKEKPAAGSSKKQKNDSRGKKRNRSKESNATAKKRKRITVQSDSSDTGSNNEEESEPERSPSPEPVPPVKARSPSPPKVTNEHGKRRVLKMVDKTYMEDGYFVTKKVHVYESCSEDEVEVVQSKKSVTPEARPEPKGKKNTKQTSLMNFFKKS